MKKILFCYLVFGAFINLKAQNELETREINGVKISFYENEIPIGNHSLIGLYIGTLGAKPFKLFITKVTNNKISGYSITGNNKVSFTGIFTSTPKKYEIFKGFYSNGVTYKLKLSEPKTNNINGNFALTLDMNDTVGTEGSGTWISYNKTLNRKIILESIGHP